MLEHRRAVRRSRPRPRPSSSTNCCAETLQLLTAPRRRGRSADDLERARKPARGAPAARARAAAAAGSRTRCSTCYAIGRVRGTPEWCDTIAAVDAETVRAAFQRMLAAGPTVALGRRPAACGRRTRAGDPGRRRP
ncbi:MAG: hypothetical protein MZW92_69455 [Comamonadaceae bacterium]|nr:hypothetical protein [Comamonadaceae bacterium]